MKTNVEIGMVSPATDELLALDRYAIARADAEHTHTTARFFPSPVTTLGVWLS